VRAKNDLFRIDQKGGLTGSVTATVATPATQEVDNPATVATVAVAKQPEPRPELTPDEASNIRAWLAHIEETDPAIIAEVLDKCRTNLEARRYFLKRSEEVPEPTRANRSVHCGDCIHFDASTARTLSTAPKASRKPSSDCGTRIGDIANAFYQGHSKPKTTNQGPLGPQQKGEFPK